MKDLAQHERELLLLLKEHIRLTPTQALNALGWDKDQLALAKTDLASKGLIRLGRGGTMELSVVLRSEE